MAENHPERREVNARIVYWGMVGAGKTTNLRAIHAKLRPDHRGELRQMPTRLDPSATYDVLPIELGEIAGVRTRIQIVAVPGGSEHTPTRKQLLDQVDGVVFVIDARRECLDENIAAFEELRGALAAYGHPLERLPIVLQYNKQDLSDPYALEELHRKLDVGGAAVFEAVASEGVGVLQTLTTISKAVVRSLREGGAPASTPAPQPAAPAPPPRPAVPPRPAAPPPRPARAAPPLPPTPPVTPRPRTLEEAALAAEETVAPTELDEAAARTQVMLDASWPEEGEVTGPAGGPLGNDWRVADVGRAEPSGPRAVVLPLRVTDGSGRNLRLRVTVSLDPWLGEDDG